jgi:hypothetical protein
LIKLFAPLTSYPGFLLRRIVVELLAKSLRVSSVRQRHAEQRNEAAGNPGDARNDRRNELWVHCAFSHPFGCADWRKALLVR